MIFVDGIGDVTYKPATQMQLKNFSKSFTKDQSNSKEVQDSDKEGQDIKRSKLEDETEPKKKVEDEETRRKRLEDGKKIILTLDETLPKAETIKIYQAINYRGCRLKIYGWVHRLRRQGKNLMFITLRDGTGFLECVLNDVLCQTYNAILLSNEASVMLIGFITEIPKGKNAPGGHEMHVDYWELVAFGPPGGADHIQKAEPDIQADNRHIMIRSERNSKILKMRSVLVQAIREHYFAREYCEVTPPTILKTQGEDISTLFKVDFFGETAHLTQSSQLYLETCLSSLGDVFCFGQCFIAEKIMTCSHLAENTLLEVECPFIELEGLMVRLEDLICDVVDRILKSPYGLIIYELNPDIEIPEKPFMRMNYSDAIKYLNDNNISRKDGRYFEFGDDIPEMTKRLMADMINKPILLCRFPSAIKPFYMSKYKENEELTESIDLLLPDGGEIAGGSMRIWHLDELLKGYEMVGIDPELYFWYNDQRKYGSCPHGGYGLRLERLMCWLLNCKHISEACLYPRYFNNCKF
ncbi:PREDICTED: asparagine--tRNA ligase, cytoplasmic-like isoform X2 [Nicrophorus vespilloides]|nr:PREDICTED: asparagine--tRNA ligase, cytoplasmic-like isoform X2 [Nicrophorus vespilloides]